jgi:hypothetical protein
MPRLMGVPGNFAKGHDRQTQPAKIIGNPAVKNRLN